VPPEYLKKNFDEGCFYCGDPDHGRSKCPKLTAKLKSMGLRRVAGQWVPGEAAGEDNGDEEYYLNILDSSSSLGSGLGVLLKSTRGEHKRLQPEAASASRRTFAHPNRFAPVAEELGAEEYPPPSAAALPKRPPRPPTQGKTRLLGTARPQCDPEHGAECGCAPLPSGGVCVGNFDSCACLEQGHPCLGPQGPEELAQNKARSLAAAEFEEARVNELLEHHLPAVEAYAADEGISVGQALTELAGGNMPVAYNLRAAAANPVLQPTEEGASASGASLPLPPAGYHAYQKAPQNPSWQPSQADRKQTRWARRRAMRAERSLSILQRGGPTLSPVSRSGASTVRAIVDSGAEETVAPPGTFCTPVVPSVMSESGQTYTAANGAPIKNLGRTTVAFRDKDDRASALHFEVAEVTQPLVSVAGLCDAGNVVIFHKKGAFIHSLTSQKKVRLARVGNTYVLDMVLPTAPAEEECKGGRAETAFRRPE